MARISSPTRPAGTISRRDAIRTTAAAAITSVLAPAACGRRAARAVVLYSSIDDDVLRPIVRSFEQRSGVRVLVAGDTEATKTTGLVQRLLAEAPAPRADVWWSGEPFGTIRLARAGVLTPYVSPVVGQLAGGWPAALREPSGLWHGLAMRARVLAYDTRIIAADRSPRRLRDLLSLPREHRVGMARPASGTTRGHLSALVEGWGEGPARAWLTGLRDRGLRLYDGNSAVVRAIAAGEIAVGLTDTDDVHGAADQGWPVAMAFESPDPRQQPEPPDGPGPTDHLPSFGPMLVPCTVGVIAGGPNPAEARRLADELLSDRTERALAGSRFRNLPIRPVLAAEFPATSIPDGWLPDLARVASSDAAAMALAAEVLGPV